MIAPRVNELVCLSKLEAHLVRAVKQSVDMSVDWKEVRRELIARKNKLFDRFVKDPAEVGLSI